jgi:uncharacterized protein with PIN domain
MRFFLDAMLPHQASDILRALGHEATSPAERKNPELPDRDIIEAAISEGWIIVTENWSDFVPVRDSTVILVNKQWWSKQPVHVRLASALVRWAEANPEPGPWPQWLPPEFR